MIFVSVNFVDAAGRRGDMMKHSRFHIRMAESNLFPGKMLLKFKDEIGLTEKQEQKISKMSEMFQEANIRANADLKIQEMKLKSYIKKDNIDRKKMEKMIRDIAKFKTDMQIDRMNYLLDVRNVLTPEQIKKIEALKKEKRQKWMKKRKARSSERRYDRKQRY